MSEVVFHRLDLEAVMAALERYANEELGPGPFRGPDYAPRRSIGVPVDVLVYTPQERESWGPRFRRGVEEGRRLYERA